MQNEGKNDAMLKRMFRNAYDTVCQTTVELFFKFAGENNIKLPENTQKEIYAFMYFVFDFTMSMGPEEEIRNTLRKLFAMSLDLAPIDSNIYSNRAIEYINEMKNDKPNSIKMRDLGNVFAGHINNANDPLVGVWILNEMTGTIELVNTITKKIMDGLPNKK